MTKWEYAEILRVTDPRSSWAEDVTLMIGDTRDRLGGLVEALDMLGQQDPPWEVVSVTQSTLPGSQEKRASDDVVTVVLLRRRVQEYGGSVSRVNL
jgi:hypothetical protein